MLGIFDLYFYLEVYSTDLNDAPWCLVQFFFQNYIKKSKQTYCFSFLANCLTKYQAVSSPSTYVSYLKRPELYQGVKVGNFFHS